MSKRLRMKKTKVEVEEYAVTAFMEKYGHVPRGFRKDKHMMVMLPDTHGRPRVTVVARKNVEYIEEVL